MSILINAAGYRCWRKENSFEGVVSFRPFPHANLTSRLSKNTATTKMELLDQVTLCLAILKVKTIVLVA